MLSRRTLLRGGLAAATYGLLRTRGFAAPPAIPPGAGFRQLASSPPLLRLPRLSPSILVDGLPFLPGYLGDYFDDQQIPFHVPENQFANGAPPAATENVDVAIVGGGLSGLMTAYLLRRFHPVVLDYQPRFGGTSMGEEWSGLKFSLGGAYFMNPDPGSELEQLYEELELDRAYRLDSGENPTELDGAIQDDFWDADDLPPDQRLRFQQYRETVQYFANEQYPDIPLDESADNDWILDLDRLSFRQHIEQRLGGALPPRLASAIQGYFVSSFGASWDEVSAAGGWNFVAAEESGRWVMPGGNAYVLQTLWQRLTRATFPTPDVDAQPRLRPLSKVVDVRRVNKQRWQVTWRDSDGVLRALAARRVVLCCPKHVAKYVMHDLPAIDDMKRLAMDHVHTAAYLCVNILLNEPLPYDFYDLFLLRDGSLPLTALPFEIANRPVDVINARFARHPFTANSVLTLYWPLPWAQARRTFLTGDDWTAYATALAPQIRTLLGILGLRESRVQQVRMARWGHALPVSEPNFIADGWPDHLRRPIDDQVFFVHQDNWVLPAFETCALEALHFAPQIGNGLS